MFSSFLQKVKIRDFDPRKMTPRKRKKFWRMILFGLLYFVLGLIFIVALLFAWFSKDLPTPDKIANMKLSQSTKIYDRTGQILLYETGDQKRTIVTSSQIPQNLKDATVSIEDANFYKHHGIDFMAILKAIGNKLLGRTNRTGGASTITQQYVKNSFLTPNRSLSRKIKEAILSIELEFMYNKDQILTMYLNEIPYGNSAAGAEAAAKIYYNTPAKDLDLAESATLAAIPNAPSYYSPYGTHVDALITRKNKVLDAMVKNGKIGKDQADKAKAEDTTTIGKELQARHDSILAPHFAMYVIEQVAEQYGEDAVQKQGLKIITTLDYDKQKIAEKAVDDGMAKLAKYGGSNGALVAIDPNNGQILAMVGSKDYFDTTIDGNVNVADSSRQPGSSFKPFAYATAFKQPDYSPSKMLYDFTTNFGGNPPYIPQNYTGKNYGPVTMRQALSNSLNVPAVKVMSLAGIDNVLRTASDMGITTLTHRDQYGLSLVLGAGEVKPVEMAGAFGTFATGGVKHPLDAILKISDSNNKAMYEYKDSAGQQVLDPQIAYEISNILSTNETRALVFGTHTALYFPDRTVAVKTGTTSNFKDAWTVGYTPSIAVAVWTGNNNSKAMSSGADGSVVAAPIFHQFIVNALAGTPSQNFAIPPQIKTVTVEKYSNKLPSQYSSETTTDIFADWQAPTTQDNVHKIVKVCKGTNLVATDNTPAELTEDKVFADLHSERPDNPSWEGPVHDWAVANGLSVPLPTDQCNASNFAPTISISAPIKNTALSGLTTITTNATDNYQITKVEFYIDGVLVNTATSAPYSYQYDFSLLASGSHNIKAIVTDEHGITAQDEISISVSNSSTSGSSSSGSTLPDIPTTGSTTSSSP